MTTFKAGTKVFFGRSAGEKTLGEIVKVNRTTCQVKQLESRGTMKSHPIGTIWKVPFALLSMADGSATPTPAVSAPAPAAPSTGFKVGDRVEFDHPSKGTIAGTVSRVNAKTVTLENTSDNHPIGWRVGPAMLRPAKGGAVTPPVKPAVPAGLAVGKPVSYEGYAWKEGERGPVKGPVTGVITAIDVARGEVEVFSGKATRKTTHLPFAAVTLLNVKRSEAEIHDSFMAAHSGLEPENLSADGERPRAQVAQIRAELNRALRALAAEYGRMVDSGESFSRMLRARGQGDLADRMFSGSK